MADNAETTAPYDLVVRGVRPWGSDPVVTVAVRDGRIAAVGSSGPYVAHQVIDLDGSPIFPAFIEPHIHLDKVFTQAHGRGARLAEATSISANVLKDPTGLEARAQCMLSLLERSGVCVVRSHVNIGPTYGLVNLERVIASAQPFRDRIELQLVAFADSGMTPGTEGWYLIKEALDMGCAAIGGSTTRREDPEPFVASLFGIAASHGCDVDIHVDEHIDPHCRGLEALIRQTRHHHYAGRVLAGHCCALGIADPATRDKLIEQMRELDITVVALPLTNLFLQGRGAKATPSPAGTGFRGLAPVRDLFSAGVRVLAGCDNVQDAFLPFGNGDPLLTLTVLGITAQLSTDDDLHNLHHAMTTHCAAALGVTNYGLAPDCNANFVALDHHDGAIPLTAPMPRKLIVLGGKIVSGCCMDQSSVQT